MDKAALKLEVIHHFYSNKFAIDIDVQTNMQQLTDQLEIDKLMALNKDFIECCESAMNSTLEAINYCAETSFFSYWLLLFAGWEING